MTVIDLEQAFPGLFVGPGCETAAEAERYADQVAGDLDLRIRVASWTGDADKRLIKYENEHRTLGLTVEIASETAGRSRPSWLFHCFAERLDAGLTVRSQHVVRAKPEAFQRDAKELIRRLRVLKVEAGGRIRGTLKRWNGAKGYGVLETVPGANVLLQIEDLPGEDRNSISCAGCFSFQVRKIPQGQKAINVRRCFQS